MTACQDQLTTEQSPSVVAQLEVVSGQDQLAPPGTMLPDPLVVKVTSATGTPLPNRIVNFLVTAGGGSPYAGVGITNASGIAQEYWTLGPQTGPNTLEARAVDSNTGERMVYATFTATAQAAVASVTVTPASPSRVVGGTVQLTATTKDAAGTVLTGRTVTWTSANATVATVSASGKVTAKAVGSAVITATSEGVSGTASVSVTAPPPPVLSDTIFYDGFESGTLNAWEDGVSPSVQQVITDPAVAFAGSRSLEMTIPAGSTGSWISRFFMPGYDSVFVRFQVKLASDWTGYTYMPMLRGSRTDDQWSSYGKADCPTGDNWFATNLVTQDGDPGHLEFFTSWVGMPRETDGITCLGHYESGSNTTYISSPSLAKNQWYRVEFWVKLNAPGQSNAIQRFWVDGQQRGEWSGLNFRTTTNLRLNSLTLHAYGAPTSAARHLYYDEVLVSTTSPYVSPGQGPEPAAVATVTVAPVTSTRQVGATVQLTATTKDASGATLSGRVITWATSNATVATVNASGLVTARAAGIASITASSEGQSGSATVTVTSPPPPPAAVATVTVTPSSSTRQVGGTVQLTATTKDASGATLSGRVITWATSNATVATVNASGLVTARAAGIASITASSEGKSGSATVTVTSPPPPPTGAGEPQFNSGVHTVLWRDDFEYGLESQLWNTYITNTPQAIHVDNTGLNGTKALRVDWSASGNCTEATRLVESAFPASQELYLQYWVKYDPGFAFGHTACGGSDFKKFFFFWRANGDRWYFGQTYSRLRTGFVGEDPENVGGATQLSSLADGQWHRFTFHIKVESSASANDGLIRGWIDGQLKFDYRNIDTAGSSPMNLFKVPTTFNEGAPKNQSEWMDGFTIWR